MKLTFIGTGPSEAAMAVFISLYVEYRLKHLPQKIEPTNRTHTNVKRAGTGCALCKNRRGRRASEDRNIVRPNLQIE